MSDCSPVDQQERLDCLDIADSSKGGKEIHNLTTASGLSKDLDDNSTDKSNEQSAENLKDEPESYFDQDISDRELVFKIYEDLKKLNMEDIPYKVFIKYLLP
jgi:hypothetical protein